MKILPEKYQRYKAAACESDIGRVVRREQICSITIDQIIRKIYILRPAKVVWSLKIDRDRTNFCRASNH